MWLAVLALAGGALYLAREEARQNESGEAMPLAAWVPVGWRVATAPDRAGPYQMVDESPTYAPGDVGGFTYNTPAGMKTRRVNARPDVFQRLILLRAADGEFTIAGLEK